MKNFYSVLIISVLLLTSIPSVVLGQMFSVDDSERPAAIMTGPTSILSIGFSSASFDFTGENVSENNRLDFDDLLFKIQFNTQGLDLSTTFGGSLTGMDDQSYVNLSARIYNNFPLKRSPKFRISLPIQLTTDLTQVSRDISSTDFRQSSLTIGSGIASLIRPADRISIQLKATPNYGFSFSQGSVFGGSLFRLDGIANLMIHNIFGTRSLVIGYNFDLKNYDIDGDIADYEFTAHTVTLGIGF
jgi:hypothetical protein